MLLMGTFDKTPIPSASLDEISFKEDYLEFTPSQTLLSRPDIKQAEHLLRAANANIGVARAAFFPSISLSGNYGYFSRDLSSLFDGGSWLAFPQVNLPIFDGGKNKANLKLSEIDKNILIAQYQKAIQTAFTEVLEELVNRKNIVEQIGSYDEIVKLNQKSYEILQKQYLNGTIDAVVVADSHLKLIAAKQNLILRKQQYLKNLIMLYKTLGGGGNLSPNA